MDDRYLFSKSRKNCRCSSLQLNSLCHYPPVRLLTNCQRKRCSVEAWQDGCASLHCWNRSRGCCWGCLAHCESQQFFFFSYLHVYSNKMWTGSKTDVKALTQIQKARKKKEITQAADVLLFRRKTCFCSEVILYTVHSLCTHTCTNSVSLRSTHILLPDDDSFAVHSQKKKGKKSPLWSGRGSQPANVEVLHFTSGSCAVGDGSVYHPVLAAKNTVIKLAVCISLFWCCFFSFYETSDDDEFESAGVVRTNDGGIKCC